LRPEVVDLVGLKLVDELDEPTRFREVGVVEEEPHALLVRIAVQVYRWSMRSVLKLAERRTRPWTS